jgi:hypothetical protein
MSLVEKLFSQQGSTGGITRETLAKDLLTEENLETKTEIPKPLAMSVLDVIGIMLSPTNVRNEIFRRVNDKHLPTAGMDEIKAGTLISMLALRFRINMISKGRQSRHEFLDAIKPSEFESDRQSRRLERLFGGHLE